MMNTENTTKKAGETPEKYSLNIESVHVRWDVEESPDLSCIGEHTDNYSETHIVAVGEHAGEIAGNVPDDELPGRGRDYRYFIPYAGGETPTTDRRSRYAKYAAQDFKRMDAANRGEWQSLGCYVVAEVSRPIGQGCKRLETFQSGGLWGIESDSDESYRSEIESEQFADLAEHLRAFGIETSADSLRQQVNS
jgi:hypothetical protein